MKEPPLMKKMQCSNCSGSGLVLDMNGEPTDCRECDGTGLVAPRDNRGRFLPWINKGCNNEIRT